MSFLWMGKELPVSYSDGMTFTLLEAGEIFKNPNLAKVLREIQKSEKKGYALNQFLIISDFTKDGLQTKL